MSATPEQLRAEAEQLRRRADEVAEDNPTAASYHRDRAAWCEYLARSAEQDRQARADERRRKGGA